MTENNGHDNGRDTSGKFLPGNPGKPKGTSKNQLRDKIKTFLNDSWESFPAWFDKLKEKDKIDTMLALLPYGVPRLQSIAVTDSQGNDFNPGATIDYTRLRPETLREVLAATTINNDNEE